MVMAVLSIVFYTLQAVSNKEFSRRFSTQIPGLALLNALALTLIVAYTAMIGAIGTMPPMAFLIAAAFGILFVITVFLIVLSMAAGPLGVTMLIINSSLIIPVLFGIFLWQEQLTAAKGIGILFVLSVLVLSGLGGGKGGKRVSLRWLALTLMALLCNGTLSVLQKAFIVYSPDVGVVTFSFWTFLIGAVACWTIVISLWMKGERFGDWVVRPFQLGSCAAGIGMGTVGGSIFLLASLAKLPAIVSYPVVQGGVILLLWLVSLLFYREKIRVVDFFKLGLGLSGIVLLSI